MYQDFFLCTPNVPLANNHDEDASRWTCVRRCRESDVLLLLKVCCSIYISSLRTNCLTGELDDATDFGGN